MVVRFFTLTSSCIRSANLGVNWSYLLLFIMYYSLFGLQSGLTSSSTAPRLFIAAFWKKILFTIFCISLKSISNRHIRSTDHISEYPLCFIVSFKHLWILFLREKKTAHLGELVTIFSFSLPLRQHVSETRGSLWEMKGPVSIINYEWINYTWKGKSRKLALPGAVSIITLTVTTGRWQFI